ncbi:hypothetical protein NDU88_002545 [Pleurodeles waltl]|uniref:Uncharacterized protein n=1 Tax=Pleurodeles waltl TaxID=8319 RepID=A0AAV7NE30_PLEWA|nr:hypothetical protein NDU88_002545 [Pleurodeles waltl]
MVHRPHRNPLNPIDDLVVREDTLLNGVTYGIVANSDGKLAFAEVVNGAMLVDVVVIGTAGDDVLDGSVVIVKTFITSLDLTMGGFEEDFPGYKTRIEEGVVGSVFCDLG